MTLRAASALCQPVVSSQTSHRTCLPLFPSCVLLSLRLSLQESVAQQLDSSGRRQSGCARGSPLSPSGAQLHQPHHRGSLQRPQGRTHSVSNSPPARPVHHTPNPLIIVWPLADDKAKVCRLRAVKAEMLDIGFWAL